MQAGIRENTTTHGAWCVTHPLSPEDSAAMTALRSVVAGMKGKLEGNVITGTAKLGDVGEGPLSARRTGDAGLE